MAQVFKLACCLLLTSFSRSSSSPLPHSFDVCRTFHELKAHKNRVSCLGVNYTGQALCTGSWDTELAVWA